jgi:molybdate transport system permease protein
VLAAFVLSIQLALLSCLILLVIGIPLAWALARKKFAGRRVLEAVFLLPLTLPPTVLGFYLLMFLGQNGPLARGFGITWAFRFEGLLLGSVLFSLPFALTSFREAFRAIDTEFLEVARCYGASWQQTWWFVILPLSWPGIFSGSLLAFAHTVGEFGVVLMLGGSIPGETQTISIYLYDLSQSLKFDEANRLAAILLVTSFVILFVARTLEERWRENTGR